MVASIFHTGRLLAAVQSARVFADSKAFVDMPLREGHTPASVLAAFDVLPPGADMAAFVAAHFDDAGSDFEACAPEGWSPTPPSWVSRLPADAAAVAAACHARWPLLTRRSRGGGGSSGGSCGGSSGAPPRSTLLPLPFPFVVPGDRFREAYYWDSAFAVDGLIASGCPVAAEHMCRNLLHLAATHGRVADDGDGSPFCCFVPNGSRSYYSGRSQPPLLASMLARTCAALPGRDAAALAAAALPVLEGEWEFWSGGDRCVTVAGHALSRYAPVTTHPRPESWREDVATCAAAGCAPGGEAEAALLCDIAAAAESGWDFSTRWMHPDAPPDSGLAMLRTRRVLPADLNGLLAHGAACAARLAGLAGDAKAAAAFAARAAARTDAVNAVLWDEAGGQWRDWELPGFDCEASCDASEDEARRSLATAVGPDDAASGRRSARVFASNWVPLACGCGGAAGSSRCEAALASLSSCGLLLPGGASASLCGDSGHQWDFPNAWPPLALLLSRGCEAASARRRDAGARLARRIAGAFLRSVARGLAELPPGRLHEKYDARAAGRTGGGGEYPPQTGFAWTAGVALSFLRRYGTLTPEEGAGGWEDGTACEL